MNLSTCTRQRIPSLRQISRRCLSSTTARKSSGTSSTPKTNSRMALPPAKMRALIALYHQTDKWVTPENLEERIDEAFVSANNTDKIDPRFRGASRSFSSITFEGLQRTAEAIDAAPRMAQWNAASPSSLSSSNMNPGSWSSNRAKREHKVIEALYGVVTTPEVEIKPGYEVVQESAKYLKD